MLRHDANRRPTVTLPTAAELLNVSVRAVRGLGALVDVAQ